MGVFPLSEQYRRQLVERLEDVIGIKILDPLVFLKSNVLAGYPDQSKRVLPQDGETPFYDIFIRNLELSAWAVRPPIIVTLMRSFQPFYDYTEDITKILTEGPEQCHPQDQPYYVCRVLTQLPLIGRLDTRVASVDFEIVKKTDKTEGKRVFRVFGPPKSGKTHTLKYFEYLAAVQPPKFGVVSVDLGNTEIVTQAAAAQIPIELFLVQNMEAQVNRWRGELTAQNAVPQGEFPDLRAIRLASPRPRSFKPLTEVQQRLRWSSELALEFVSEVIESEPGPQLWILVFDNCEKASAEAKEFVRNLVMLAAGHASESGSFARADEGSLRIVLLGDSQDLLPPTVYANHIAAEDLNQQSFGLEDLKQYFRVLSRCRVELDEPRIEALAIESMKRAQEIQAKDATVPEPKALADAVLEKSNALEALAAQKGEANGN
jgi:hypothetical protein